MGVLTHLDMIKKASAAKKTKTELKKRFWAELYKVSDEIAMVPPHPSSLSSLCF